jgi:hypothetical protein
MNKDEALRELGGLLPQGRTQWQGVTVPAARPDSLESQLERLVNVAPAPAPVLTPWANPAKSPPQASAWDGLSAAGKTIGSSVAGSLLSGLTLAPWIRGLMHLFGGGSPAPLPELPKYAAPASIGVEAGLQGGEMVGVSRGASDRSRVSGGVTVQVNAMDARSFLDRSDEIAQAVRRAVLESNALADVVGE